MCALAAYYMHTQHTIKTKLNFFDCERKAYKMCALLDDRMQSTEKASKANLM